MDDFEYKIVHVWGKPWDDYKDYGYKKVVIYPLTKNLSLTSEIKEKITYPKSFEGRVCAVCNQNICDMNFVHIKRYGIEYGKRMKPQEFDAHNECIEIIE